MENEYKKRHSQEMTIEGPNVLYPLGDSTTIWPTRVALYNVPVSGSLRSASSGHRQFSIYI